MASSLSMDYVFICDYDNKSGNGHLARCAALSSHLLGHGLTTALICKNLPKGYFLRSFSCTIPYDFLAQPTISGLISHIVALQHSPNFSLILDSYRLSDHAITHLGKCFKVIFIDDLGRDLNVHLVLDYRPNFLRRTKSNCLLGPRYFLTSIKTQSPCVRRHWSVLAHAGGGGNFADSSNFYNILALKCDYFSLSLTWLVPSKSSYDWLTTNGLLRPHHHILLWDNDAIPPWGYYHFIVGPASTSVYETLLLGSTPISFPISQTQLTPRSAWLKLGHAFHITNQEKYDNDFISSILDIAFSSANHSTEPACISSCPLDSIGTTRVANQILNYEDNHRNSDHKADGVILHDKTSPSNPHLLRLANLSDCESFLTARKLPVNRKVSTDPSHLISWEEHLNWWINSPNTIRFSYEQNSQLLAYIWHKLIHIDRRLFITAGWFPASENTNFFDLMKATSMHCQYCDREYPHASWFATVRSDNRAVISLNKRLGFRPASSEMHAFVSTLYPHRDDSLLLMERVPS